MKSQWLRKISVRYRIIGGFLILLLFATLSGLLLVTNQFFLVDRLQQATNVEARADRLLLLASARVESSRINLARFTQGVTPSPYEARNDVDEAVGFLQEAQNIVVFSGQQEAIQIVLEALGDYRALIDSVETITQESGNSAATQSIFLTYRLGNDISQRIEQTVSESEVRLADTNEAVFTQAAGRLLVVVIIFVVLLVFGSVFSWVVSQSIMRPVQELQSSAEAFEQGQLNTQISVSGTDELSLLGTAFNSMAAQISDLVGGLEQLVADRTRALETSNEVARNLSKIVNIDELTAKVVDLVRNAFDYYHAQIYLFDDDQQNLILVGGTGKAGKEMLARGHRIPKDKGLVGHAAVTNAPVFIGDVTTAEDWLPNPLLPDTTAEIVVPIAIGDQVLGVLDVQHNVVNGLQQNDIDLLESIAAHLAIALQNARIYEQAQHRASQEARFNEINRTIQSTTDVETAMQVAVRELGRVLDAKQVRVQLQSGQNGRIHEEKN